MDELKTKCKTCHALILQTTAERTGGLCMPCVKNKTPKSKKPPTPIQVTCTVAYGVGANAIFKVAAQDLLDALTLTRHVGDESHANKAELEAQKALLRHALLYQVKFQLHDDHWRRTCYALVKLFEADKAELNLGVSSYRFSDVVKEDWSVGESLAAHGGFLYKDHHGSVIFKMNTWVS